MEFSRPLKNLKKNPTLLLKLNWKFQLVIKVNTFWLIFYFFFAKFGARIENMDDVIEQVISEVRKRHKRSLWGRISSLFENESSEDDNSGEDSSENGLSGDMISEDSSTIIRPATRPSSQPTKTPSHDQKVTKPDHVYLSHSQ